MAKPPYMVKTSIPTNDLEQLLNNEAERHYRTHTVIESTTGRFTVVFEYVGEVEEPAANTPTGPGNYTAKMPMPVGIKYDPR